MILIINICKEEMHYYEFVKPIEDILIRAQEPYIIKHYSVLKKKDLEGVHRLIIAGTSLMDMSYSKNLSKFNFLKNYDKPVLAICGGMQLLCLINGCHIITEQEIGLKAITFNAEFLGVSGSREVYTLHNMAIKDDLILKKNFHIYAKTECVQAVKHREHKHYGVLFHPEVRNKDLIVNFLSV